jgi:uncharacterized DUF497 family protein
MWFEWDGRKRQINLAKHGLDFRRAGEVFAGNTYTKASVRGDERRWMTVGLLAGVLVAMIWTRRDDAIRIISLRRARREERQHYRELFG